jgi:hypothetical protein
MMSELHGQVLLQEGLVVPNKEGDDIRPYFEQLFAFLPIRKQQMRMNELELSVSLAAASE